MAQIVINEVSQNYSYVTANASYCSVALPITACWGPGFEDPTTLGISKDLELESVAWSHFPATQAGLESFISTFRGPAANYRSAKDYSYQIAMTLISAGYDVDVCRLCPGTHAQYTITDATSGNSITVKAKYAGTFGNNLLVHLGKVVNRNQWNAIVYVTDSTGVKTAVENIIFAFDIDNSTDSILHIDEISSNFVTFERSGSIDDATASFSTPDFILAGGADRAADGTVTDMINDAATLAGARFGAGNGIDYIGAINSMVGTDVATAAKIRYNEWLYTYSLDVYDLLKDKLAYNPSRIISPWDDQNITEISGDAVTRLADLSPIHIKIMQVAYYSRCATGLIDIPKCLPRSAVYNPVASPASEGYAQKLSRYNGGTDLLFATHSALFAPWGQYTFVGTSKQAACPPSVLFLLIQRAMILNQSLQYEWAMPTSRKHNIAVGKLDYTLPKRLLDEWQSTEGTGVNVITTIPDLGTGIWGNSTLYELPPATYQALWNLSTRFLVNAVENTVYKAGLGITFQYNNEEAYSRFYAAVTPLLDTMKNVGAIEDYKVRMSADINNLDSVNANSVIGKIYLKINGVINDITVDLICLPPTADLSVY